MASNLSSVLLIGSAVFATSLALAQDAPRDSAADTPQSAQAMPGSARMNGTPGSRTASAQGSAGSSAASRPDSSPRSSSQQGSSAPPVVLLLVPVAQQSTMQGSTNNGCWARLYDKDDFRGDQLTLVGPVDMPNMTGPFGLKWDIMSVEVGPRATVTGYDNKNFSDRSAIIQPGQRVAKLEDRLSLFEDVKSVRISCSSSGSGASTSGGSSASGTSSGSSSASSC